MTWVPEDLTAQIDGATDIFNTTFERNLGEVVVLFVDGNLGTTNQIPSGQFTEIDSIQLQLGFAPSQINGDRLLVEYDTDETLSGRVIGLPDPPSGIPPPALPPITIPPEITTRLDGHDLLLANHEARIIALEALSGIIASAGVDALSYGPGVGLRDVVFWNPATSQVEKASASSLSTMPALGMVRAIDTLGPGIAEVQFNNSLGGFSGLISGKFYIASKALGGIVASDDFLNPNYPTTGNFRQFLGQATSSTTLLLRVNPDTIISL